jgi:hypothetical protein
MIASAAAAMAIHLLAPLPQQTPPPAPATALPAVAATVQTQAEADGDRLVCRTESVVGSNRRRRVCMTVRERDERRETSNSMRDRLDRNLDPAAGNPASASSGG